MFIATFAALLAAFRIRVIQGPSDFAPVWYGAHSLLHGINPYETFGPGRAFHFDWPLNYPLTAMLAALPFGFLSEPEAAASFAAVSAGLLAFAVTRENWERSWIFFSPGFIVAAKISQWSPLIGAALFLPALGFVVVCKPNLGAALAVSTPSTSTIRVALVAGAILVVASLAIQPGWPLVWWRGVTTAGELSAPITRGPGFLVALALLRWRQPEARLLLALSCVPQTASWYETLLPLLVARTKREMQALVFASGLGYLAQIAFLDWKNEIATTDIGVLMVVFVYLPALAIVMRRPNEGAIPAWMQFFSRLRPSAVERHG